MMVGCPTDNELKALSAGDLPPPEHARLRAHVLACDVCRERARAAAGGEWMRALEGTHIHLDADELADIVARVMAEDGAAADDAGVTECAVCRARFAEMLNRHREAAASPPAALSVDDIQSPPRVRRRVPTAWLAAAAIVLAMGASWLWWGRPMATYSSAGGEVVVSRTGAVRGAGELEPALGEALAAISMGLGRPGAPAAGSIAAVVGVGGLANVRGGPTGADGMIEPVSPRQATAEAEPVLRWVAPTGNGAVSVEVWRPGILEPIWRTDGLEEAEVRVGVALEPGVYYWEVVGAEAGSTYFRVLSSSEAAEADAVRSRYADFPVIQAVAYERLDLYEEALAAYRDALDDNPDAPELADAVDRMEARLGRPRSEDR